MLASRVTFAIAAAFLSLSLSAAKADILYFNGPIDGITNGTNIATGAAADSFTLSAPSQLQTVEFGAWVATGHLFNTVDWAILNDIPGTGSVLYSGTAAALNNYLYTNLFNYDVYLSGFFLPFPFITLNAGTYWLELSNAMGDTASILWDINGGASRAWTSADGEVTTCDPAIFPTGRCSNSFRLNGTAVTATPEPSTIALMGALLALLGLVRRPARRRVQSVKIGGH